MMNVHRGLKILCILWLVLSAATAMAQLGARSAEPTDLRIVLPIYNERGLDLVLSSQTEFHLYMKPGDTFMIVSGNVGGDVDTVWINEAASALRQVYPNIAIITATSGLSNVAAASLGAQPPIEAVVYIYEPNFPNIPEFTWDFQTTLDHLSEASAWAQVRELRLGAKPTGRPLLQRNLLRYNWNYAQMGEAFDELFIQTQTYCKEGTWAFEQALERVIMQVALDNPGFPWYPQVTVDPKAPNGTTVERAFDCAQIAQFKGLAGVLLWWSPVYPGQALNFLRQLRAPPSAQRSE